MIPTRKPERRPRPAPRTLAGAPIPAALSAPAALSCRPRPVARMLALPGSARVRRVRLRSVGGVFAVGVPGRAGFNCARVGACAAFRFPNVRIRESKFGFANVNVFRFPNLHLRIVSAVTVTPL